MGDAVHPRPAVISRADLPALVDAIRAQGYALLGPTVRDGTIQLGELGALEDLPIGWGDEQSPGSYRLHRRGHARLFGWAVGPGSWKQMLFPSRERMWSADRTDDGFVIRTDDTDAAQAARKVAFFGVRPCELAAIAVQDRVFVHGAVPDRSYSARRERALVVAVDCGEPSGTCFCVSMGTGPSTGPGYDLALTELDDERGHRFLARGGTDIGAQLVRGVPHRDADARDHAAADAVIASATARMGRQLDTTDLPALLERTLESPRWDDVAQRCLTCANCTLVCPTCFCSDWVEVADLSGDHVERWRRWASCFTLAFSTVHGGTVRASARSRYRQWLTHKLGTWWDQFGTSGCVGCGRCITWCPVGIDLTEEVRALRELDRPGAAP